MIVMLQQRTSHEDSEYKEAEKYYKSSPLLLEADIIEEISNKTDEILRKQKTVELVLDFPKKLTYSGLIPISTVAFSPGLFNSNTC